MLVLLFIVVFHARTIIGLSLLISLSICVFPSHFLQEFSEVAISWTGHGRKETAILGFLLYILAKPGRVTQTYTTFN